jgi:hypothetical protein
MAARDRTEGAEPRARWLFLAIGLIFFGGIAIAAGATGHPAGAIAAGVLAGILLIWGLVEGLLHVRHARLAGEGVGRTLGPEGALPQTHVATDTETAMGDSAEIHDAITHHDLPIDHPGRQAAEEQTRERGAPTRGDRELARAWPPRSDLDEDRAALSRAAEGRPGASGSAR